MGIFDVFSSQPGQNAANAQIAGINAGTAAATPFFDQARGNITQNYGAALQPFQQISQQAQPGVTQYGNALGLGGEAGNAAALAGFKNNPGYQFTLDQATQNILRNQSAMGALNSGNTNVDLANYTTGLANQTWQQYLQNLQPYFNQQNVGAQGQAGVLQNQGSALAGISGNQANMQYGAQTGIGNANANAALAPYNASANLWNFGGNLIKSGAQAAGGQPPTGMSNSFAPMPGYPMPTDPNKPYG